MISAQLAFTRYSMRRADVSPASPYRAKRPETGAKASANDPGSRARFTNRNPSQASSGTRCSG